MRKRAKPLALARCSVQLLQVGLPKYYQRGFLQVFAAGNVVAGFALGKRVWGRLSLTIELNSKHTALVQPIVEWVHNTPLHGFRGRFPSDFMVSFGFSTFTYVR